MPLAPLNPNCWSFCRNLSHFQSVLYTDTRSLQNRSKHASVTGDHSLPLPRSLPKPTEYKVPFLRSFEKATSTPTYSLHKGVTHLIGEIGRNTLHTWRSSRNPALKLVPLSSHSCLPGAHGSGERAWALEAVLVADLSVFSGYKAISEAPSGWLGKCCSPNPTSPPQELTQGAGIRKLPWCPTQTTLSSLVLPTIQLIF